MEVKRVLGSALEGKPTTCVVGSDFEKTTCVVGSDIEKTICVAGSDLRVLATNAWAGPSVQQPFIGAIQPIAAALDNDAAAGALLAGGIRFNTQPG